VVLPVKQPVGGRARGGSGDRGGGEGGLDGDQIVAGLTAAALLSGSPLQSPAADETE